jgi:hypothetical protein
MLVRTWAARVGLRRPGARLATRATPGEAARGIAVAGSGALPWLLFPRVVAGRGLSTPRHAD